jgi:hypothetical protein
MIVRKSLFFPIVRMLTIIVVGLVVALVVALSQINLETLRNSVISVLQDSTGLPVHVDGDVAWRLSLQPRIELNKVYIENPSWAKNKYAYMADRVDVRINLISLFRDRPTIQNVKMYDVNLNIEQNTDGNYSLPSLDKKSDANDKKMDKYPFKDFGLGGVEIKKLNANILGKKYSLSGLNVRMMPEENKRQYSGWIKLDNDVSPFIVELSEYNDSRKIYPVRIAISTKGQALIANVALEGTSKMPIDFVVKGDMPDVNTVAGFFGMKLPEVRSMQVNIAGGFDRKKITLRKSAVRINNNEFTVSGEFNWGKNVPVINASVHSHRLNLSTLFPNMYGRVHVKPNRKLNVFKNTPLFGEFLYNKKINLDIKLDDFVMYKNLNIQNLGLVLNVLDNKLRVDSNLSIAEGDVTFGIDGIVNPDGQLNADVVFVGKHIYVGEILSEINVNNFISDLPVNIDLYVKAYGKNLTEVMQTITGPVYVYSVDKGYAHSDLVAYMYGTDFLTSLRHSIQDLFNSEKKYNQIKISCLALNAKLRNGVFETQNGFAIETNAINVRLAGNMDLGAEKMNLALTTVPVRGLKLSLTGKVVNSIELSGDLAEPGIKVSGAAVASKVASATGIGLLLAPLTGGLSLVAGAGIGFVAGDLLENWLADAHPCETALKKGAPLYQDDPEWMRTDISELMGTVLKTVTDKDI